MRDLFAAHLAPETDDPTGYSLRLHDPAEGAAGTRELNLLFRGSCPCIRSTDRATVVAGLVSHLRLHAAAADDRYLVIPGVAIVVDDVTLLVPLTVERQLASAERRLRADGIRITHAPMVAIDTATGDLVLDPDVDFPVDEGVLAAVGAELHAPERRRVARWLLGRVPGRLDPVPAAEATAKLLATARNGDLVGSRRALAALAGVFEQAQALATGSLPADDLVTFLRPAAARSVS